MIAQRLAIANFFMNKFYSQNASKQGAVRYAVAMAMQ